MTQDHNFLCFPDPVAVARAAADFMLPILQAKGDRPISLALSGGNTPQLLYRLLSEEPYKSRISWGRIHVFLADERHVPHDHVDSNMKMAREALLDHVPIPPSNVHAVPTEFPPEAAADAYQKELDLFFQACEPIFDLMILGMGPDGHTVSLFPGRDLASHKKVAPVYGSPKPPPTRLTLTLPVINLARNILFLVTGADKAPALRSIRERGELSGLPAARVRPESGTLTWLVDEAANA